MKPNPSPAPTPYAIPPRTPARLTHRRAERSDAALITGFIHAMCEELEPGSGGARDAMHQLTLNMLGSRSVAGFVGFYERMPAGVIMLSEACSVSAGGQYAEITELFVAPDARGQGVARELVRAGVILAQQRQWTGLTVGLPIATGDAPSLAFYQRAGFKTRGPQLHRLI